MTHDDALVIVVRAGKEGQKELLKALCEEMNHEDLEEILGLNGFIPEEE